MKEMILVMWKKPLNNSGTKATRKQSCRNRHQPWTWGRYRNYRPGESSSPFEVVELFFQPLAAEMLEDRKLGNCSNLIEGRFHWRGSSIGIEYPDCQKSLETENLKARVVFEMLAKILGVFLQLCWETVELPNDWKKANISTIFKKGPKGDTNHY